MKQIKNIKELIDKNFPPKENEHTRYFYRGVSNSEYMLIPKISRTTNLKKIANFSTIKKRYDNLNEYLKTFLPSYGLNLPEYGVLRDWIELFHAQHYGAPTNLLDFSRNPLVALFFACQPGSEKNSGMVYRLKVGNRNTFTIDKKLKISPFKTKSSKRPKSYFFLDPPHENLRIRAQDSIFCFIPIDMANKPITEIKGLNFESFEILEEDKPEILRQLHMVGVNAFKLFPDLHGFGTYLNWKIINRFP